MVNYFFSEEEIFTFDQIFDFGNTINERIQKLIDLKSSDQGPNKKGKYIDNNDNNNNRTKYYCSIYVWFEINDIKYKVLVKLDISENPIYMIIPSDEISSPCIEAKIYNNGIVKVMWYRNRPTCFQPKIPAMGQGGGKIIIQFSFGLFSCIGCKWITLYDASAINDIDLSAIQTFLYGMNYYERFYFYPDNHIDFELYDIDKQIKFENKYDKILQKSNELITKTTIKTLISKNLFPELIRHLKKENEFDEKLTLKQLFSILGYTKSIDIYDQVESEIKRTLFGKIKQNYLGTHEYYYANIPPFYLYQKYKTIPMRI
jgi:hypothetical protein